MRVPAGSHSGSGDDVVFVLDVNHPSLPTHFYFVVVSIPVFVALSTVFHSINPPHNSLLSHSVLPVSFLLISKRPSLVPFSFHQPPTSN